MNVTLCSENPALTLRERRARSREKVVLETVAVVLIVLWLLGFATSYTLGGLIHVLLVIAAVVILIRILQGRRVL
jgi:asparagine N-glycosylation enzyme membrane subunit Stt3